MGPPLQALELSPLSFGPRLEAGCAQIEAGQEAALIHGQRIRPAAIAGCGPELPHVHPEQLLGERHPITAGVQEVLAQLAPQFVECLAEGMAGSFLLALAPEQREERVSSRLPFQGEVGEERHLLAVRRDAPQLVALTG